MININNLKLKQRFIVLLTVITLGFLILGGAFYKTLQDVKVNGPIYQKIVLGKDLVADILPPPEYIIESYLTVLQLAVAKPKDVQALASRLAKLHEEYDQRHAYWLEQTVEQNIKTAITESSFVPVQRFYQFVEQDFIPAVIAGDQSRMSQVLAEIEKAYLEHRSVIDQVIGTINADNSQIEADVVHSLTYANYGIVVVFLFTLLSGVGIALIIANGIVRKLGGEPDYAAEVANRIASGDLSTPIHSDAGDSTSLIAVLQVMQQKLRDMLAQEAREKVSALRVKLALDKASANVMMADAQHNIIYVNDSLKQMFLHAQEDLRTVMPDFDVHKLLGANIDIFHKNPAYQRAILDNMQTTINASFEVGGRYMDFVANPVRNPEGERLGTVVEWQDRTSEIKIENEIKQIVDAVKAGELDSRLNTQDKTGFLQTLSISINELTAVIEQVINDVAGVMQSMSSGDLTHSITSDYEGIYGSCKNDINATIDKLREVFTEIKNSSVLIRHSAQEIASGNNNLSQRAEQQASNLQQTAASMEELTSTVKNNANNAQLANQLSADARVSAQKGGQVVDSAIRAMQDINESSNKIAAIIGVIDEIAFQTNLLALNASVEAARAGEHGRGFSVVATEVRNLAQRSANAARESKSLIQNSIQKVRVGSEFVNETGEALNEIVGGVKQVSEIIAQIAAASDQQSSGIAQVNQAVAQLDEITQQNAALAEEAAASSLSMDEQTSHMSQLLAFFHIEGRGKATSKHALPKFAKEVAVKSKVATVANLETASEWDEF